MSLLKFATELTTFLIMDFIMISINDKWIKKQNNDR